MIRVASLIRRPMIRQRATELACALHSRHAHDVSFLTSALVDIIFYGEHAGTVIAEMCKADLGGKLLERSLRTDTTEQGIGDEVINMAVLAATSAVQEVLVKEKDGSGSSKLKAIGVDDENQNDEDIKQQNIDRLQFQK
ncbi:MAG: hypothetical protein EZS28_007471 [Streblomastix strix]|uniref:Uncharacterized protein n=1 Tax=Streblomastix strix TaxID=222440 RepID=A0A5J4WPS0_9EUKA|nr:MAG: hypothetical protein EZS28_007471 [Streblomastix strix]